ncbi:MAG: prolipoprotein diacylglyceryl transferase, partial [Betaproteobacteria bacterium]|nr:prolipoprotein diacylglyceryl transferase [Betaproteobacteria bacterium]
GVVLAAFFTAKKTGAGFLRTADFAAMLAPIGLGLGRIGNFINGELPGRPAPPDLPWAMIFPGDDIARHPSPLYQAFLEGAVLAAVMLFFAAGKRRPPGFLAAVFLVGYGICRVFSEFFRQPDAHIGLLIGGFSMGQLLSAPMLLLGFGLLFWQTGAAKKIRPRFVAFSAALSKISKTIRAQINSGGAYFAAAPAPATNPGGGEIAAAAAKMEKMKKTGNSENPEKTVNPETMEFTAPVKPFWKKIFATKSVAAPEKTKIRAASRRQKRRQKKKKRD